MYWAILLLGARIFATTGWELERKSYAECVLHNVSYEGNREYKYGDLNKSIISNLILFRIAMLDANIIIKEMIGKGSQNNTNSLYKEEEISRYQEIKSINLGLFLLNKHTSQGDPEAIKLLHKILSIFRQKIPSIIGYTAFNELNKDSTDINLRRIGDNETEIKSGEELRETILRLYPHLKEEIEAMLPKVSHNWFSDKIASMASTYFTSMFSSNRNCNHTYKKL